MAAVRMRLTAEVRARGWSWVAAALLVGIAAGAVFVIASAARRTDSAYPRFLASHAPGDFLIGDSSDFGFTRDLDLDAVAALPQVADSARMRFLFATGRTDTGRALSPGFTAPMAPADDRLGTIVDRWKLIAGRRADPRTLDEVVPSFEFAREHHLAVGSTLRLKFLRTDTFYARTPEFFAALPGRLAGTSSGLSLESLFDGPALTFRVVGIEASAFEFPPLAGNLPSPLHLSRGFFKAYAADLAGQDILHVRLRDGANATRFSAAVEQLSTATTVAFFSVGRENAANVQRSLHLQAVALWLLAGFVAVAAAFAIAQAFGRQALTNSDDFDDLSALGMSGRGLVAIGVLRAAVTSGAGIAIALGVAVLVSPLFPVGLARNAEPNPGIAADWLVLGVGTVLILALCVASGWVATRRIIHRASRLRLPSPRVSLVTRLTESSSLAASTRFGLRLALQPGRGRSSVPVRSAIVATALAVVTMIVAATFAGSIDHLLSTPRLYGWAHDVQIGSTGLPAFADPVTVGLAERPTVHAFAAGTITELGIGRTRVAAFALDNKQRSVRPDLLEGRALEHDDEIILGTKTLRDAHASVGDRLAVGIGSTTMSLRIVGRAVFPDIGDNGQLDRGAQITFAALRRQLPDAPANIVHVTFVSGVDRALEVEALKQAAAPLPMLGAAPPTDLTSFGRVDNLPGVLAAVMLIVSAAVLTHTMITSVRRRRRDFAILEALGWVHRQVSIAVVVQATAFASIALAIGIPLGIVIGRRTWDAVATEIGVPSVPVTSLLMIGVVVAGLLVVAIVAALVPAWLARRVRAVEVLRAE